MRPSFRIHKSLVNQGMTLIEVVIALMLLIAFMGVYVAVTEFINRFMGESEKVLPGSQGLLMDQHQLQMAMDRLADILAQPGIEQSEIASIIISGCTYDPIGSWSLPGQKPDLPPGYRICLRSTSLVESPLPQLLDRGKFPSSRPGIYVLQALPDEVSATTQQSRRVFCRPKPFC
jgi:prepilin-type N-terminal cleavage/methylation domain-containing protein